jgi:hypothetical protein
MARFGGFFYGPALRRPSSFLIRGFPMDMITVGCKLPNGILLKVGSKTVALAGSNASNIIGGYGLTQVDKEFFDTWKAENSTLTLLRDDLIFDNATKKGAESQAREQEEVRSGLEPIDPEKLTGAIKADDDAPKA